ncbi:MAG: alpha/beta fold hydrolase, partial [Bryobacteraceae bacterium]
MSPASLGVLFVHGIGKQARGETLSMCAGKLIEWLQAWLGADRVWVRKTVLSEDPAHSVVDVDARSILLAESWWASDFKPPAYGELARWMLTFGSWIVISHFLHYFQVRKMREVDEWLNRQRAVPARFREGVSAATRGILSAFAMILIALALFAVEILIVVVWLLSVLPVPALKNWASTLLLALEGVMGDSFAFSANPVTKAAIATRVQRDLEWLLDRCENAVVVAHSQGAAVAVHALKLYEKDRKERSTPNRVRKLVTYGSGLAKLTQLEEMARPPRSYPGIIGYIGWIMAAAAVSAFLVWEPMLENITLAFRDQPGLRQYLDALVRGVPLNTPVRALPLTTSLLFGYVLAAIGLLVLFVRWAQIKSPEYAQGIAKHRLDLPDCDWVDLFATHDPVPNGPLPATPTDRFQTRAVTNTGSLMKD